MDRETKKYLNRARGVSSDGVPNRKGGSWPNHPSMRYELPIPFSPGADSVNDDYREGYCRTFGCRPGCGHDAEPAPEPVPATKPPRPLCHACGKEGEHRIAPGILSCE